MIARMLTVFLIHNLEPVSSSSTIFQSGSCDGGRPLLRRRALAALDFLLLDPGIVMLSVLDSALASSG